jgi:esterase
MPEQVANGVRLHYEERGEGAPILCIHGAGSSAQLWTDAMERLAQLGRAISYDRRAYGRSERREPLERISVAEHTDDAAALLDALEAAPAVVVARSYGGEVATDLALRYPDRVRALVLLEAAPVELLPAAAEWTRALRDRLREVAAGAGVDALGEALIGEVLGEDGWGSLPDEVRQIFRGNGPAALADLEGEWLRADAADLATIDQPVLLVAATDSTPRVPRAERCDGGRAPQRPPRPGRRRASHRPGSARGARLRRGGTRTYLAPKAMPSVSARLSAGGLARCAISRRLPATNPGARYGRGRGVWRRAIGGPCRSCIGAQAAATG